VHVASRRDCFRGDICGLAQHARFAASTGENSINVSDMPRDLIGAADRQRCGVAGAVALIRQMKIAL